MKPEISVGIILVKEKPIKFLLMKRKDNKVWDFPKGHLLSEESYEISALRELKEETQISDIKLFKDFKEELTFIKRPSTPGPPTNPLSISPNISMSLTSTS